MIPNFLMFLGMMSILVIVLVCAYFTTRWLGTRLSSVPGIGVIGQKLALVYRLPIGRDQQLVVVKVANRHLVIGCTPSQMTFITELTQEESEELFAQGEAGDLKTPSFAEVFSQLRGKSDSKKDPGKSEDGE